MTAGVGNDVIDLDAVEPPRAAFLERVLSKDERELLRTSADRSVLIWMLWSAKETAYKALARAQPGLVFAHAAFEVRQNSTLSNTQKRFFARGLVAHGAARVEVRWTRRGSVLACAGRASSSPGTAVSCSVERASEAAASSTPLTPREEESVYGLESRAARLLARRKVCARLGVAPARVEIVRPLAPAEGRVRPRRGAPEVWLDGAPLSSLQLSLSHHGRFVGCALLEDAA